MLKNKDNKISVCCKKEFKCKTCEWEKADECSTCNDGMFLKDGKCNECT
jgi:hypothetical protein